MFKCNFHTNLDLIQVDKHNWPDQLPFRPMVGDYIRSSYIHPGRYDYQHDTDGELIPNLVGKGFQLELIVCRVMIIAPDKEGWGKGHFERFDVELHLPPHRYENLTKFYNWYEKITGHKFI